MIPKTGYKALHLAMQWSASQGAELDEAVKRATKSQVVITPELSWHISGTTGGVITLDYPPGKQTRIPVDRGDTAEMVKLTIEAAMEMAAQERP